MTPSDPRGLQAEPVPDTTTARPCPICGKPSEPATRPFCSKRCSDVDLNRWLGGVYALPSTEPSEEEGPV